MRSASAAVLPALAAAAGRTGVPFDALFHTARLESGLNPDAKAKSSSATGLFQFIDSTWMATLAKHGARHGITPGSRAEALALRRDPGVASLMAAEHMADNAAALEAGLGQAASPTGLYLAHFLGSGGAVRFLKGLAAAPEAAAAELFPAAARANRPIFYAGGAARSLQDVYDLFTRRLGADAGPSAANPGVNPGANPGVTSGETASRAARALVMASLAETGAEMTGAEMTGAEMTGANMIGTEMTAADIAAAEMADAGAADPGTSLQAARLAYLLLAGMGS